MKKFIHLLICCTVFISCNSSKDATQALRHKKNINAVVKFLPDTYNFLNADWSKSGDEISYAFFEEQLTANLDNDFLKSPNPISFFTEKEIEKNQIKPDWIIYVKFTNLQISSPIYTSTTVSERQVSSADNATILVQPSFGGQSNNITLNEPYAPRDLVSYTTSIPATTVSQESIKTNATIALNIQQTATTKNLSLKTLKAKYLLTKSDDLYQESFTLSNSAFQLSEKKLIVIMENLYEKIYPEIKSSIKAVLNNK